MGWFSSDCEGGPPFVLVFLAIDAIAAANAVVLVGSSSYGVMGGSVDAEEMFCSLFGLVIGL